MNTFGNKLLTKDDEVEKAGGHHKHEVELPLFKKDAVNNNSGR
jgi:hypothetical protein